MAKFRAGEVMYYANFHGKNEAIKCVVVADFFKEDVDRKRQQILVTLDGDDHACYVLIDQLYSYKKHAKKRVSLERQIYQLRASDVAEKSTELALAKT